MYEADLSNDWLTFRQRSIPMPDGTPLAADLYLPTSEAHPASEASLTPVPAILELLPYRKDEDHAARYALYSYFVQRGYAVVRVDIRGTGASHGTLPAYEYSEQEQDDAEAVIAWIAEQDWCSGRVGMFGISWGGFNSIQLGMRAPEPPNPPGPLRAIVAACATDDLFFDDVHYLDGMMHLNQYEIRQDLTNALTAAPDFPLDDASLARGFDTEPWVIAKLQHPQNGPFWQRGSLNTDYTRLRVPALLLGGYYDAYRDSVPRMLQHLQVPTQALVGPWPHQYPHNTRPGPRVEWRERAVRWFDHFLKPESPTDRDSAILEEPALTYFQRDYHPPDPNLQQAPGRWRTAPAWPPPDLDLQSWTLEVSAPSSDPASAPPHDTASEPASEPGGTALESGAPPRSLHAPTSQGAWPLTLDYVPGIGFEAGTWWGDLLDDQAPLDEHCLIFESPPLQQPVTILGLPTARLRTSASAETANWFVRLNDLAPDGAVTAVTGGGRSGAHRNAPTAAEATPEAITPNEVFDHPVELHFTSWTFAPGHRIRLAISNALWPMFWPTPHAMHTTIQAGSTLELPVLTPTDAPLDALPAPTPDPAFPLAPMRLPDAAPPPNTGWTRTIDQATGDLVITSTNGNVVQHPWGRMTLNATTTYRLNDAAPATPAVTAHVSRRYELANHRTVEWQCDFLQTSDAHSFSYELTRRVLENDTLIRERTWDTQVPRGFH